MAVHYLPEGYNTVNPYLIIQKVDQVIDFLVQVFDAVEVGRLKYPDGKVSHAELQLGTSRIMLSEAIGDMPATPAVLVVYVPDADKAYQRALMAGAKSVRPPTDQLYGDRSGGVTDLSGNQWWIHTHIEDVPFEEIERRMTAQPK
ncbi:VOC family protein [Aquirhabdus sp.]|uniref:VOC family protein n=1 Tax=Aquirhabdus sp. TaxID=2824160 RepID=UPI00396C3BFD